MTELRERMQQDMRLAGLADATRSVYALAVSQLANHYRTRPDLLTEGQVRDYLLNMVEERRVAQGTFVQKSSALRFFYLETLGKNWVLFTKNNCDTQNKSVFRDRLSMSTFCN